MTLDEKLLAVPAAVFAALDQAIAQAPPAARPGFVVALAARLAQLGAGMTAGGAAPPDSRERVPLAASSEELLTPEQAIEAVGGDLSRKWLLRHTKGLRFRRDLSRKVIRFERAGLLRWMAATAKKAA